MRVIGLVIGESRAQVVEVIERKGVARLLNATEVALPLGTPRDALPGLLLKAIQAAGIKARKANLLLSPKAVQTVSCTIPAMTHREMESVVRREIRKALKNEGEEIVFDYTVVDEALERGVRRLHVQATVLSKSQADLWIAFLKQLKVKPLVLSTIPFGALSAFSATGTATQGETCALADIGDKETFVTIARGGKVLFSREIPSGIQSPGDQDATLHRIFSEIRRSILYFNQQHRTETVQHCYLTGHIRAISDFLGQNADSLPVPVSLFDIGEFLDVHAFHGQPVADWSTLSLAYGAAHLRDSESVVNLLPEDYIAGRYRAFKTAVMVLAVAAALLMDGGLYWLYRGALREQTGALTQTERNLEALKSQLRENLARLDEIEGQRTRVATLQKLAGGAPAWSALLEDQSAGIPESLYLTRLSIDQARNGAWALLLEGKARAANQTKAQEMLEAWVGHLNTSPYISAVVLRELNTVERGKSQHSSTPPDEEDGTGFVQFSIGGTLVEQP